jgi:hypothetical protein
VDASERDHRQVVLAFDTYRRTYSGVTGCSDLAGRFAKNGASLTASSDKSLQICRVDKVTDEAIRGVMHKVKGYRVTSTTLELLDAKGVALAKLER